MKALVDAFNKEKALVGASSGHCEASRSVVDSWQLYYRLTTAARVQVRGVPAVTWPRGPGRGAGPAVGAPVGAVPHRVLQHRAGRRQDTGQHTCKHRACFSGSSKLELETKVRKDFTIMEKVPTRAFSWLKAPTSAITFNTLLRHYADVDPW